MYGALDVRTDGRTYYVRTAFQLLPRVHGVRVLRTYCSSVTTRVHGARVLRGTHGLRARAGVRGGRTFFLAVRVILKFYSIHE